MKSLYINGQKALIREDIYFPFSYTINTLENINLINFPSSKTIQLNRCKQNDDIFGHIAELTRVNYGFEDSKTGVLFNQIKKASYELFNESVIVSKGEIIITNATEEFYELNLIDGGVQLLEDLGNKTLVNNLLPEDDIAYSWNGITNISNYSDTNLNVVPLFTIDDSKVGNDSLICYNVNESKTMSNKLDFPLTNTQSRTFKTYDLRYGFLLSTLLGLVQTKYPSIKIDSNTAGTFKDLYLLSNKPINVELAEETIVLATQSFADLITAPSTWSQNTTTYAINGVYRAEISERITGNKKVKLKNRTKFRFRPTTPTLTATVCRRGGVSYNYSDFRYGDFVGNLWVKNTLDRWNHTIPNFLWKSEEKWTKIELLWNVNCKFYQTTTQSYFEVEFVNNIENTCYFGFDGDSGNSTMSEVYQIINYDPTTTPDEANKDNQLDIFGYSNASLSYKITDCTNELTLYTKAIEETHTGDAITINNILGRLTVKDLLLNLAKTFDLNLRYKYDGEDFKLILEQKKYYKTVETPILDVIENIEIQNFDYSKMIINSELADSDWLKDYELKYKEIYGQKTINTGYTIRKGVKEIKLPFKCPLYFTETNNFGFDSFAGYKNGGYAKNPLGITKGINDTLSIGYIKKVNEEIFICNDTAYEAGWDAAGSGTAKEFKIERVNEFINYDSTLTELSQKWKLSADTTKTNTKRLSSFYTFSPYHFNNIGLIDKSVQVNKPYYNYGDITDAIWDIDSTLYEEYYAGSVEDKLNSDTHTLVTKMFIDGEIDIYKIYNIKGTNYLVSEISEYDPTEPNLYSVKLLRVNEVNNYRKYNLLNPSCDIIGMPYIGSTYIEQQFTATNNNPIEDPYFNENLRRGIEYSVKPLGTAGITPFHYFIEESQQYPVDFTLTGLQMGTIYYYRAFIDTINGRFYGDNNNIKTNGVYVPLIIDPSEPFVIEGTGIINGVNLKIKDLPVTTNIIDMGFNFYSSEWMASAVTSPYQTTIEGSNVIGYQESVTLVDENDFNYYSVEPYGYYRAYIVYSNGVFRYSNLINIYPIGEQYITITFKNYPGSKVDTSYTLVPTITDFKFNSVVIESGYIGKAFEIGNELTLENATETYAVKSTITKDNTIINIPTTYTAGYYARGYAKLSSGDVIYTEKMSWFLPTSYFTTKESIKFSYLDNDAYNGTYYFTTAFVGNPDKPIQYVGFVIGNTLNPTYGDFWGYTYKQLMTTSGTVNLRKETKWSYGYKWIRGYIRYKDGTTTYSTEQYSLKIKLSDN